MQSATAPTDRRSRDLWAFDKAFVARLIDHASSTTHRDTSYWDPTIRMYWRAGCSRRQLADQFGLSFEAVRSRLATIRKAAQEFLKFQESRDLSEAVEPLPVELPPDEALRFYPRVHVPGPRDMVALAIDHDEDIQEFFEAYKCSEFERYRIVSTHVSEKDDWFAGRAVLPFAADQRTRTTVPIRGRPVIRVVATPTR